MTVRPSLDIRDAVLPDDLPAIERLWLEYLIWGNTTMEAHHGIHPHSPRDAVAQDIASIAKFQPPDGQLLLAVTENRVCGIGCLRRIGPGIAESSVCIWNQRSVESAPAGRCWKR